MPVNVVKSKSDEKKWREAKSIAKGQGKSEKWPLVMHIYQNMKKHSSVQDQSREIVYNLIAGLSFTKEAGILDKLKEMGEALTYDLRLALQFPGERAFQSMLRGYDKAKIKWLTRELKRLARGQKKLVEDLAKAQTGLMSSGAMPPPPVPKV